MHDRLFANQRALSEKDLTEYAKALGLDMTKFQECLDKGKDADKIKEDMEDGRKAGISGTPSFLLGFIEPDGTKVKAVKKIVGAQPYAAFKEAIDTLLKEETK